MTTNLTPMDEFGTHLVPFEVAVFCRSRRLSIESTDILRSLRTLKMVKQKLEEAEQNVTDAEVELRNAVERATKKMKATSK